MLNARYVVITLVLLTLVLVFYKVVFAGYELQAIVQIVGYEVSTAITFEGHDEAVRIRTYLPRNDDRQMVGQEVSSAPGLNRVEETRGENRLVTWTAPSLRGPHKITATYHVSARALEYVLPAGLPIPS